MSAPVVRSFHHADSGTWTHVVVDPATRHAAIVDAVLDYDAPSGTIRTASAQRVLEYVARPGSRSTGCSKPTRTRTIFQPARGSPSASARSSAPASASSKCSGRSSGCSSSATISRPTARSSIACSATAKRSRVGEIDIRVLAMPGHTADSIAYIAGDAAFVGDTLFAPKSGTARCDFPGGDAAALHGSIRRLYELPDATRVFLCHDYPAADAAPVAEIALAEQKHGNIHVTRRHRRGEVRRAAHEARRDARGAEAALAGGPVQLARRTIAGRTARSSSCRSRSRPTIGDPSPR